MRRFAAEVRKLALLFRADPRAVTAGIIAPTAIILIFALTFGNMASLRVAVVNEDAGPHGSVLAATILGQESPAGGRPYVVSPTDDLTEAERQYAAGESAGYVHIPADFSARLDAGEHPAIGFTFNNYSTDMAKNLRLYVSEGIVAFYEGNLPEFQVERTEQFTAASQVDWFDLIAVGVFMLAALVGTMYSFLYLMYKERQHRTDVEYALSPAGPWSFWWARVAFSLVLGFVTASVNALLILLISGLNLFAAAGAVLGPLLLLMVIWLSLAAILSLTVDRFAGAAVGSMVVAVLSWFIGGGTASIQYLGGAQRVLAELVPNSHVVDLMRAGIFGYEPANAAVSYAIIVSMAVVLFGLAAWTYRRRLWRR